MDESIAFAASSSIQTIRSVYQINNLVGIWVARFRFASDFVYKLSIDSHQNERMSKTKCSRLSNAFSTVLKMCFRKQCGSNVQMQLLSLHLIARFLLSVDRENKIGATRMTNAPHFITITNVQKINEK